MPPTSPLSDTSRNESGRFTSSGGQHPADMSLPPDQRRHLLEMESSFRADEDPGDSSVATDFSEILSGTVFGRVGDMGPPPIPVNLPKRRLQRSASNISTRSSKSSKSISTSKRISTTREGLFRGGGAAAGGDKQEQYLQSPILPSSQYDPENSSPDRTPLPSEGNPDTLPSSPIVAAQTRNSSRSSALGPAFIPRTDTTSEEIGLAIERRPSGRSSRDEGSRGGTHSTEVVKSSSASSRSARMSSSSASHGKRRPKFLKSRQSDSQRSSISSMTDMNPDFDNDGASTITAGGIGGGVLSRSTSLGSIASGVTGLAGSGGSIYSGSGEKPTISLSTAAERALARLDEDERNFRLNSTVSPDGNRRRRQPSPGDSSPEPKTPTDQKPSLEPTDTVITAHVKSIHIPPTVTREYHSRHPSSPSKRPGATPVLAQGKNMTLKEQSFIIDRLQKENFDLKIKVFYLNEKLEKQSDEGIKEMMKENVDMKVKLAEGMRERKALKKRVRELEKKIEEMGGEKEGEEDDGELWELRERVERYEVEIEELTRKAEKERKMREETGKGQPPRAEEDMVSDPRFFFVVLYLWSPFFDLEVGSQKHGYSLGFS